MRWRRGFLLVLLVFALRLPVGAQEVQLNVVATTTILADVAQNVGGDLVNITPLLPSDTDTHAYEPSADDAVRVARADMLLTVGAGYEVFLGGLLENVGGGINTVEVSRGLELLGFVDHEADDRNTPVSDAALDCEGHEHEEEGEEHHEGECDPHIWMNPQNVVGWVHNIVEAFSDADPSNADTYRENGDVYIAQLEALDAEIEQMVAEIPEGRRILVTHHAFMGYFAERYGFDVVATILPGSSTGGEVDPQSLAELIALVQEVRVPAIFTETSANPQIAEVLAQESGVAVVTSLYSESLGGEDSPASTYIDLMRYNARTIADALSAPE